MVERPRVLVAGPYAWVAAEALSKDGRLLVPAHSDSTAGAAASVTQWKPDIAVLYVGAGRPDQVAIVEAIAMQAPYATVVVIGEANDLSVVTGFMQAGADGYLLNTDGPEGLADYLLDTHDQVVSRKRHWSQAGLELVSPRRPQLVATFSPKGGVGKTTLAVNLAVALEAVTAEQVTLLDMDLEAGDVATVLDLQPRLTTGDWARALAAGEDVDVAAYLTPHSSGIRVLAAPPSPALAESVRPEHVRRAIATAKLGAEFVVADTAPSFTDQVLAVLDEAQSLLLLLTPDVAALKNVRTALDVMADLGYPAAKIHPVMNRHAGDHGLSAQQVEELLGRPVAAVIPNDPTVVTSATNSGKPFVLSHPEAGVSKAVLDLARLIAAESRGGQVARRSRPGFWRRLLNRR